MQIRCISSAACCLAMIGAAGMALAASPSKTDKQFLITAAKTDMIEAHEGQMAENQATRADEKDFAKTLVKDHTESYQHLTALAAKTGVSIPKGIDSGKDRTIQQLEHLKGSAFDRQFARDEVAADRHAVAVFKREAAHGQDPAVKAYASQTIPVLEKQLQLAEQCAKPASHT